MEEYIVVNDHLYGNSDINLQFINQLRENIQYTKTVLNFWELFEKTPNGEIATSDIKQGVQLFYAVFKTFFTFEEGQLKRYAETFLAGCNIVEEYTSYDKFCQAVTLWVFYSIENVDLRSSIAFLDWIYNRIVETYVMDHRTSTPKLVDWHFKVIFYSQENVEFSLKQEQRYRKGIHPFYYEELVEKDSAFLQASQSNPNCIIKHSLIDLEQITPAGICAESILCQLQNSNYKTAEQYAIYYSSKYPQAQQRKLVATIPATLPASMPVAFNQSNIASYPILSKTLSDNAQAMVGKEFQFYRLNSAFVRPIHWAQFQADGKTIFFNSKSEFFTEDDFGINQIAKLHKKWDRKAVQQKKQLLSSQLQGQDLTATVRDQPKPITFAEILQAVLTVQDEDRLRENIEYLKLVNSAQQVPSFEYYMSKFVSAADKLPTEVEDDVIEFANKEPLQMMVIGKPRCGKTTFSKELAKRLDLEYIDLERVVNKIFDKIRENEENPKTDEEGNPVEFLTPLEREVLENLKNGNAVRPLALLTLMNQEFQYNDAYLNKGFILDVPIDPYWANAILSGNLRLPKINCRYFTHVVELHFSEDHMWRFSSQLMERGEDLKLSSQSQRDELRRPKPKRVPQEGDDEEEEPPEEEDEENKPQPMNEADLFYRPSEDREQLQKELRVYQSLKPKLEVLHQHLIDRNIVTIEAAGLSLGQLVECAVEKLHAPLRPLAVKLEGGSEKELLTVNLEEQKTSRTWSKWQQTDAVELYLKEKVVPGKVEFACDYAGKVFLFDSEENQSRFMGNPRKFLRRAPTLPGSYSIAVVGARQSGKKSVARLLAETYGWKLVDIEGLVREKIGWQKGQEKHVASTFDPRVNDIHLTENEWKEFYKGNAHSYVLPMVLNYLGVRLQRKPAGWGEPKKEEDDDEEQKQEEEKKAKKVVKKKKEEEKKEELPEGEKPPTPPPEDVPTKEVIPYLDAELKVASFAKGYVIVGYPSTQEHVDLMNLFGMKLDKVIVLNDKTEDNPGAILQSRLSEDYSLEQEMQYVQNILALTREAYGDENVKEISIEGSLDEVFTRVRRDLDPFFIRVDDENLVRGVADLQEGDDPLPWGDYGPYCPVTLKHTGWLVPGKEDQVAQVNGKLYRFYAEKELNEFKDKVEHYLSEPQVPDPRIMLIGVRGSGLKTQLKILNEIYKLPVLRLKDNLVYNLEVHRKNRMQERYFLRGFKAPELDEEGNAMPDAEINEESAEFDKKQHEVEVVNQILKNVQGVLMEGNFFDVNEEVVQTPLLELLQECKKLPETVVFLKVESKTFLERNFDTSAIEQEWEDKMEELRERRRQERVEARQKAIEEGVPEEELPSLEPAEGEEEEDPEAPKLDEMINEQKEKLLQQYESDVAKIEELFAQVSEELKINAYIVSGEGQRADVNDRIRNILDEVIDQEVRRNLLEKHQCYKLIPYPDPENFTINRLNVYENSYNVQISRYKHRNVLNQQNVPHIRDFPLIYKNRIYYCNDAQERDHVAQFPLKYLYQECVPNDVHIRPIVFVVGQQKSGKTTIAKLLSEKLNLVRLKVSNLLEEFITHQDDPLAEQCKNILLNGGTLSDDLVIDLIAKRIQLADCYKYGCILDGYPLNIDQAIKLTQRSIIPTVVLAMDTNHNLIKTRILHTPNPSPKFGAIDDILQTRLNHQHYPLLLHYYLNTFNNVRILSTHISNWGLLSLATQYIHQQLAARAQLARSLVTHDPVNVSALTLTKSQILNKLSNTYNYCPVLLKVSNQYQPSSLMSPHLLFYDHQLYLLSSSNAEQDFIANPLHYITTSVQLKNLPLPTAYGQCLQQNQCYQYQGYCPVDLLNQQLKEGHSNLLITYKTKLYLFCCIQHQTQFESNPNTYKNVALPPKLPIQYTNNKSIAKKVAKRGDCTSYMELHLRNIIIKVLAQLGYKRMKYPTLSCKETVLKFIAISLKANNPNRDPLYRAKYQAKLDLFLQHCEYPSQIKNQATKKQNQDDWNDWDQENLLKLTKQFDSFMKELHQTDKNKYFMKFIR